MAALQTLDWDVLRKFVAERQPVEVSAGCLQDWYWTAATVYKDGSFIEDHNAYYVSSWGAPGFKAEMPNGDVIEVHAARDETEGERDARLQKREQQSKALLKFLVEAQARREGGAA